MQARGKHAVRNRLLRNIQNCAQGVGEPQAVTFSICHSVENHVQVQTFDPKHPGLAEPWQEPKSKARLRNAHI